MSDLRSLLNRLSRKHWVTTLDAQKGFYQVQSLKYLTAFWTTKDYTKGA